jgi:hypothetical protein
VLVAISIAKNVFSEQARRGRDVLTKGVEYLGEETRMPVYTAAQVRSGIDPETWPNDFPGYKIMLCFSEYPSVCPKDVLFGAEGAQEGISQSRDIL